MTNSRRHRGPHPEDRVLFADGTHEKLRTACAELSWLWTRGYARKSSLKIVGDRHALNTRQRVAISRGACSDQALARRRERELDSRLLLDRELWVDGFNVITSVEAAIAGGVILKARDGCYRDMASMHGNYRRVAETLPAIECVGNVIADLPITRCRWLLDRAVSNSGRLKQMLCALSDQRCWGWTVDLLPDPDPVLKETQHVAATSDSQILDHADGWFNLARRVIQTHAPQAWRVDLVADSSCRG